MSVPCGIVYLVGAGPGAPDLISVRGLRLLRQADVVIHDALVDPALVGRAPAHAERIAVGKRSGQPSWSQTAINDLLIARARAGAQVVRLKGGDPFVFGRGSEEYAACAGAGIACVVVPGITSATAVPAAAGIAVTARGMARSIAVVTAATCAGPTRLDYAALSRLDTVVVLMGRARLHDITCGLLDAGRAPDTPAACIAHGTWPQQATVRAALADLAGAADAVGLATPAVVVIGPVARAALKGPLHACKVIVTRPGRRGRALCHVLHALGATARHLPLIRIDPVRDLAPLESALATLQAGDWIVLTSRRAVAALGRCLARTGRDARALAERRFAAVGPATAEALLRLGVRADHVASPASGAGLLTTLAGCVLSGRRVVFPRSARAAPTVADGLRRRGATVLDVVVYDTIARAPDEAIPSDAVVILHSPSAASALAAAAPGHPASACVGPVTAQAAAACGLGVWGTAGGPRDADMVALLCRHAGEGPRHKE